jgi:hypothetical protein
MADQENAVAQGVRKYAHFHWLQSHSCPCVRTAPIFERAKRPMSGPQYATRQAKIKAAEKKDEKNACIFLLYLLQRVKLVKDS